VAGRTIVITGASDDLGAAAAKRLSRSGENVVVVGRSPQKAYGDAKLENIVFAKELHRRYHSAGISTAAFHPGSVASNFGSEAASRMIRMVYRTPLKHLSLNGPEKGSDLLVWLACAMPGEDWRSGEYYSGHSIAKANKQAYDPELARELWDRSAAMIATKPRERVDP
jgi:NAD(P)-dependent dehydrogenase (short-subunit alcohol dehydrogenase family)